MAYVLNISAIVSYTNNDVEHVALTRDEFGNLSVNDGAQNAAQMANINSDTDCFTTFPIAGYTFSFSQGEQQISDVIFSITVIDNIDQCLIRYENSDWTTVSGDISIVESIFSENFDEISGIFAEAGITISETPTQVVTISFNPVSDSITGGEVGTYNIVVEMTTDDEQPLQEDVVFDVSDTGDGTGTDGDDYTYTKPAEFSFPAGSVSGSTDDSAEVDILGANNPDNTVIFELSAITDAEIDNDTFTLTISEQR